jgi:hypothetical protein
LYLLILSNRNHLYFIVKYYESCFYTKTKYLSSGQYCLQKICPTEIFLSFFQEVTTIGPGRKLGGGTLCLFEKHLCCRGIRDIRVSCAARPGTDLPAPSVVEQDSGPLGRTSSCRSQITASSEEVRRLQGKPFLGSLMSKQPAAVHIQHFARDK